MKLILKDDNSYFPPIPLYETQGYVIFECCKCVKEIGEFCVIQIKKGYISDIIYPQPSSYKRASLPEGRNTLRRKIAADELHKRSYEKFKNEEFLNAENKSILNELALAMSYPLRTPLDYSIIRDTIIYKGETENYLRDEFGKWRCRRTKPY